MKENDETGIKVICGICKNNSEKQSMAIEIYYVTIHSNP